ncbi:DUF485 domain-containing protein [Nocardia sp. CDC153]|uniref:DUF485 domain-containing protein n=1 Tax=Nocardia sp. CDC153 TaxID=3112167 RepID=UPI002DB57F60|nr:DUF485 domain-containing protein [Nocardia sp. CDC153]MEC3956878.1 DUF485 domain-containing protein [Nocardia sp. CDC153]
MTRTDRERTEAEEWTRVHTSPEFTLLRRSLRGFVFPVTALFLGWYLLYVVLGDYAHGFMATKVFGNITVGLVFGLLQFVSTFAVTGLYVRYAHHHLDPLADRIRDGVEGGRW